MVHSQRLELKATCCTGQFFLNKEDLCEKKIFLKMLLRLQSTFRYILGKLDFLHEKCFNQANLVRDEL